MELDENGLNEAYCTFCEVFSRRSDDGRQAVAAAITTYFKDVFDQKSGAITLLDPEPIVNDPRKHVWVSAFTSIAADNAAEDCATFADEALALFDQRFPL